MIHRNVEGFCSDSWALRAAFRPRLVFLLLLLRFCCPSYSKYCCYSTAGFRREMPNRFLLLACSPIAMAMPMHTWV